METLSLVCARWQQREEKWEGLQKKKKKKETPLEPVMEEDYSEQQSKQLSWSHAHLGRGLARCDGYHGVLSPLGGHFDQTAILVFQCHRLDQIASQAARCHHIPETACHVTWSILSFTRSETKTTGS